VAAVAGVATFADLSVDKAGGGYTLQATAGSLTAPSQSFTISPAAAAKLAFTVQPSMTQAGATNTPAVRAIARAPFGNTATAPTGRHGRRHAAHGVDPGESDRAAHRDPEGRERQPARRARGHLDERQYVDRDGEHDGARNRQGGRLGDDHRDERREERHRD